ncbi:MAG: type II toxin-antitoxin system Phd/YefM family antitoxin [Pyrinomonadaceae bacterium]
MRTVNVAKLKNELSTYLGYVRKGEKVLVKDRKTPIATIVPFQDDDDEARAHIAEGLMKPPERAGAVSLRLGSLLKSEPVRISARELIRRERDGR